jgi:hypothetical protein
MKSLLYSPDAAEIPAASLNSATPTDTHIRHAANLPNKDAALLGVSQSVSDKWAANAFATLVWKTQADFANDVASFKSGLESRNTEGGKRSQQTQELENLDNEIEDAVSYVKSYINEKFGPLNARAHFAEFGMVHRGGYELPRERQQRKDALRMMADAIAANGFDTKQYGTAWWADIKTKYDAASTAAAAGAGNVSGSVGSMVTLRTSLRQVLHSILLLLEANYPDTFDQVKREWGFLKEGY